MNNQMTDYMPIIVPTEQRVAAMLKGTSHKPDEVVGRTGRTANGAWEYTVKQVAVKKIVTPDMSDVAKMFPTPSLGSSAIPTLKKPRESVPSPAIQISGKVPPAC